MVIDTLARFLKGDENDAKTLDNLYRFTLHPLKTMGCSILRLDHTGKDLYKGARGSSAKTGDVDLEWAMKVSKKSAPVELTFTCKKSRIPDVPEELTFTRQLNPMRHLPKALVTDDEMISSLVAVIRGLGLSRPLSTVDSVQARLRETNQSKRRDLVSKAVKQWKEEASGQ